MKDSFSFETKIERRGATCFYRIMFPKIFSFLDKIIFIDPDTLILEDLFELYKIDLKDNYLLGSIEPALHNADRFYKSYIKLCLGVFVFNLEKIRKDKLEDTLINQHFFHREKWNKFPIQDLFDYIFYPKIGLLPLKYGIFNYYNIKELFNFVNKNIRYKYDVKKKKLSFKYPAIIHFVYCSPKPWKKNSKKWTGKHKYELCQKEHNLWYLYSKKNIFYKNIINQYFS